jgi:predicted secreted protein
MIWWIILPFFLKYIIKEKKVYENLGASIPMNFEKLSNLLWLTALIGGLIFSIFLPLQLNTNCFYIGLFIFSLV